MVKCQKWVSSFHRFVGELATLTGEILEPKILLVPISKNLSKCMRGCFLTIYIHYKNSKMIGKKHIITMVANSAQMYVYIYIDNY